MAKKIHVHVHNERVPTRDADEDGHWVTMHGAHVFIGKGGKIEKGPAGFVGKKPSEIPDGKGHAHHKDKAERAEKLGYKDLAAHHRQQETVHREAAKVPAKSEAMTVKYGGKTYEVKNVAEAQAKWNEFRDKSGAGVSEVGNGVEVMQAGKAVGRVSYNGNYHEAGSKYGPPALSGGGREHTPIKSGVDLVHPKAPPPPKEAHFAVETDKGTEYVPARVVNGTGMGIKSAHTDELLSHLEGTPKKPGEVPRIGATKEMEQKEAREQEKAKPRLPSKAALRGQAKGEVELAGRGNGSYAKAAELYEAAGEKEKAEGARALARRYGHDEKGVKQREEADRDAAETSRAQAKAAPSTKVRELLLKKAELHEQMIAESAKYPRGSDAVTKQLRSVTDEIAYHESQAQMGKGADLDDMRAAIRKEKGDNISIADLNAEMEKRLKK